VWSDADARPASHLLANAFGGSFHGSWNDRIRRPFTQAHPAAAAAVNLAKNFCGFGTTIAGLALPPTPEHAAGDLRALVLALVAFVAFITQSTLIAALLVQRARRRRAETAQRATAAQNSAILRAMPDLMFVHANDGTYLEYYTRDGADLYLPPEQFLGRRIPEVMPPGLAETFMDGLDRARRSAEPVIIEYSLPIQGILRYYEARMVCDERDRIVTIVRDVTERQVNVEMLRRREADLRASYERNRDLAGRLIASQELERERIARDLHDDLSQKLAHLNIELEQLATRLALRDEPLADRARETSRRAAEIAGDVHTLSHQLHPSRLRVLGLVQAIQGVCHEVGLQHGIEVDFSHDRVPPGVPPATALCLYRILQEGLHNVAKHSGARRAAVRLSREDGLLFLQIADQGIGFEPDSSQGGGLGLVSMQERVHHLGGRIVIRSVPGGGTRIGVRVPWVHSVSAESVTLST
jgi:signal transduction histidine kinase